MEITIKKWDRWAKEEISRLKESYPKIHLKDLVERFPGRKYGGIAAKAFQLKLPSTKTWQPEENKILRTHFVDSSLETLTKLLPKRTWVAICAQGERLDLKRNTATPRLKVDEGYFDKWTANVAYLLGYIISDGCIVKGTYVGYSDALKFGVHVRDVDILYKIKQELQSAHSISTNREAMYLAITSSKLVSSLKQHGITYRKSLRERVPYIPSRYRKDFIRGLVDGDGGISINAKGYPTLSICGGRKIISFIRNHFHSRFNIFSSIYFRSNKEGGIFPLCQITYRGTSAQTLLHYLYNSATLYLERKHRLCLIAFNRQIRPRKNYSSFENNIIRKDYSMYQKEKMLTLLPGRTWKAIQEQAWNLKTYKYVKSTRADKSFDKKQ